MTNYIPSLDADELVRNCAIGVDYASLQRRIAVLKVLARWLRSTLPSEPMNKPQTRVLVRLLLRAICNPHYLERAWIRGLYDVILLAATSKHCPSFSSVAVVNLAGGCYAGLPYLSHERGNCYDYMFLSSWVRWAHIH